MRDLRQRLCDDLVLRNRSGNTIRSYLDCFDRWQRFAATQGRLPDVESMRRYLLHLRQQKLKPASLAVHVAALRFVLRHTLGKTHALFQIVVPTIRRPLP